MNLWSFLTTTVPPTVFLLVVAWLAKRIVTYWLDRAADRFKDKLTADADKFKAILEADASKFTATLQRDNERFKSELQVEAHRRTTMFSRLHDRRAEIMAEQYKLVAQAVDKLRSYEAPFQAVGEPNMDEKQNSAGTAINVLREHFELHRIWFSRDTCDRSDAVITRLRNTHNYFSTYRRADAQGGERQVRAWRDAWEQVQIDVPPLRAALESEFRALLGVDEIGMPT